MNITISIQGGQTIQVPEAKTMIELLHSLEQSSAHIPKRFTLCYQDNELDIIDVSTNEDLLTYLAYNKINKTKLQIVPADGEGFEIKSAVDLKVILQKELQQSIPALRESLKQEFEQMLNQKIQPQEQPPPKLFKLVEQNFYCMSKILLQFEKCQTKGQFEKIGAEFWEEFSLMKRRVHEHVWEVITDCASKLFNKGIIQEGLLGFKIDPKKQPQQKEQQFDNQDDLTLDAQTDILLYEQEKENLRYRQKEEEQKEKEKEYEREKQRKKEELARKQREKEMKMLEQVLKKHEQEQKKQLEKQSLKFEKEKEKEKKNQEKKKTEAAQLQFKEFEETETKLIKKKENKKEKEKEKKKQKEKENQFKVNESQNDEKQAEKLQDKSLQSIVEKKEQQATQRKEERSKSVSVLSAKDSVCKMRVKKLAQLGLGLNEDALYCLISSKPNISDDDVIIQLLEQQK